MATPHKCPKCNGTGFLTYSPQFGPYYKNEGIAAVLAGPWHCDVCQGGIIWDCDKSIGDIHITEPMSRHQIEEMKA
jgi:hypothetical protein